MNCASETKLLTPLWNSVLLCIWIKPKCILPLCSFKPSCWVRAKDHPMAQWWANHLLRVCGWHMGEYVGDVLVGVWASLSLSPGTPWRTIGSVEIVAPYWYWLPSNLCLPFSRNGKNHKPLTYVDLLEERKQGNTPAGTLTSPGCPKHKDSTYFTTHVSGTSTP